MRQIRMAFALAVFGLAWAQPAIQPVEVQLGLLQRGLPTSGELGPRRLSFAGNVVSLPVSVRNLSQKPIDFFVDGMSWGDEAVNVIFTSPDGTLKIFRQSSVAYLRNFPAVVRIGPGETWVRNLTLRLDRWSELFTFVKAQKDLHDWKVQVRITQPLDSAMKDPYLFVGTTESKPVVVDLSLG